jgi:hypothetical protein
VVLVGDGGAVANEHHGYLRLAGEALPLPGQGSAEVAERGDDDVVADARDRYLVAQSIDREGEEAPGVAFDAWLYRFDDEGAAVLALADACAAFESAPPGQDLGEGACAYVYPPARGRFAGTTAAGVLFRVGAVLVDLDAEGAPGSARETQAALEELALAQIACLEAGRCPEPLPPPAALRGAADAEPAATETPIAGAAGPTLPASDAAGRRPAGVGAAPAPAAIDGAGATLGLATSRPVALRGGGPVSGVGRTAIPAVVRPGERALIRVASDPRAPAERAPIAAR